MQMYNCFKCLLGLKRGIAVAMKLVDCATCHEHLPLKAILFQKSHILNGKGTWGELAAFVVIEV